MENINYVETVENVVDSIKGILTSAGLGGEAGEYNLVTQSFLYKFLNDKFLYEAKKFDSQNDYQHLMGLSDDDYEMTQLNLGTDSAVIQRKDLIEHVLKLFAIHFENNWCDRFSIYLNFHYFLKFCFNTFLNSKITTNIF